jgi:hypothetical protein
LEAGVRFKRGGHDLVFLTGHASRRLTDTRLSCTKQR